jgi:hypothetical protein
MIRIPTAERLSIFPAHVLRIADARHMAIAMRIACGGHFLDGHDSLQATPLQ